VGADADAVTGASAVAPGGGADAGDLDAGCAEAKPGAAVIIAKRKREVRRRGLFMRDPRVRYGVVTAPSS
jgi:hypothetical protein